MLHNERDLEISKALIGWYNVHKRDLPWRNTTDPYIIWISEIILQQTRVNQGMEYFIRFISRFPNVLLLAAAPEDEVLKYWQGLGYYSRARNLHAAAKSIMQQFEGIFPSEYKDILSLKGVGEYTAAAIASFSMNKPYPVVDGNVFRVLSRLFAINEPIDTGKGKKLFTELAGAILDNHRPGLHNQAVMEFGALQCTPVSPGCNVCTLQEKCMAYAAGNVQSYPVKQQKTKVRNRYFHYFHIVYNDCTYLNRRNERDIWNGLFEFPMIETNEPADFISLKETETFCNLFNGCGDMEISVELENQKHVLSHQRLYATFYKVKIKQAGTGLNYYQKTHITEIDNYAIPRLIHIYLEKMAGNFVK